MNSITLKEINMLKLWVLVIIYILIVVAVVYGNPIQYFKKYEEVTPLISSAGAGLFLAGLVSYLIPRNIKAMLVFFRLNNPEPGHRAFSKIVKNNSRIDEESLKSKLGEFPEDPKKQNYLWLKLSKKHKDNPIVNSSHRAYLLYRDCTAISIIALFSIIPLWHYLDLNNEQLKNIFIPFLALYGASAFAAINAGNSFVENVLVEEIQ